MARSATKRRPPRTQTRRPSTKRKPNPAGYWDITHRPLQCLAFLLPMVLVYEVGVALSHERMPHGGASDLAARKLLDWFFSLFGVQAIYLPGLVLVVVLLAWHVACKFSWTIAWRPMAAMYAESVLLAVPLMLLNSWIPPAPNASLAATTVAHGSSAPITDELLLCVGAGIYEELVFRLIIITLLSLLFVDIMRMRQVIGIALTVIVSSLLFAAHHYYPVGRDPMTAASFAFRAAAGAYLAAVYVFRGFGLAVGSHVVYDAVAVLL